MRCWAEGRRLASSIAASLDGRLPAPDGAVPIAGKSLAIKYFTPQRIIAPTGSGHTQRPCLQIRFAENRRGTLLLRGDDRLLAHRRVNAHREQRILMRLPDPAVLHGIASLTLEFEPA